jgi:hypothetical protein
VGLPVESAFHTCTTHEGRLLSSGDFDAGRDTDVTVKAPCCRNAEKPNAAITQLSCLQKSLLAEEECTYGICSWLFSEIPDLPEDIAAPEPDV